MSAASFARKLLSAFYKGLRTPGRTSLTSHHTDTEGRQISVGSILGHSAFDQLKRAWHTHTPKSLLTCTLSQDGLVMVWGHTQEGSEVVIAYSGRELSNYSATERDIPGLQSEQISVTSLLI